MRRMHFYVLSAFLLIALAAVSSSSFFVKEELLVCRKLDEKVKQGVDTEFNITDVLVGCKDTAKVECIKSKNSVKLYFLACSPSFLTEKEVSLCHYDQKKEKLSCMNKTILAKPVSKKDSKIPG